jgi:nucleolin
MERYSECHDVGIVYDQVPRLMAWHDSKPAGESRRGGAENNQVFVGSLSYDSNEEDLRQFFADCGRVVDVRIPVFADCGRPRGIAFVEFESDEAANKACEKDGMDLQRRQLKINIANARGGGGVGGAPRGARPFSLETSAGTPTSPLFNRHSRSAVPSPASA